MSVLLDYEKIVLTDFSGPNLIAEPTDVLPPFSLVSNNIEYTPGNVATRLGYYAHRAGLMTGGVVSGAFNFQRGVLSKLIWCVVAGSDAIFLEASYNDAVFNILGTGYPVGSGLKGASFAQYGRFVYVAPYDNNFLNGFSMVIVDMEPSTPIIYGAFSPPLTNVDFSFTTVVSAGGDVTIGNHVYAVVFQDKTGFLTRPSPIDSLARTAYPTVAVTTAGQKISVTITPATTWPLNLETAFLVMTSATNAARLLYVPIAGATVSAGTATPVVFGDMVVADVVLDEQLDIGDLESVATQNAVGSPPFPPYFVFPCGDRMGYLFEQGQIIGGHAYSVAISDPGNPQHVTADRHVLQLPQQRQASCAFAFQGTVYLFGPNWTYAYTDTGDVPVLWPRPNTVDDKLGTAHPYGISIDATGFGFVAHRTGLYLFQGGQYGKLPVSYWQTPLWNQIDWSALQFNVTIDAERFRVYVFARFMDGTRKMLVWDYTNGFTPDAIQFSVHTVDGLDSEPEWGLIVMNRGDTQDASQRQHLWISLLTSTPWYLARNARDSTPYLDGTSLIGSTYQLPYLPGPYREVLVHEHHGLEIRAQGVGGLLITAYPLDQLTSQVLAATSLLPAPGKEYTRFLDIRSEGLSYKFTNSHAAGDWFRISTVRHFHVPYARQR